MLICALLRLPFILLFFRQQNSWGYYLYILVVGLAAAARFSARWESYDHIVGFGRFAGEVSQYHFRPAPLQHLSLTYREASVDNREPLVTSFEPQLWFTALPSPTTAGL